MASSRVLQVNVDELMQKQEKPNTTKIKNIYWSLFVKFLNENAIGVNDIKDLSHSRVNDLMAQYFAGCRTKDGELYKLKSYGLLHWAVVSKLNDILRVSVDKGEFSSSHQVYVNMRKKIVEMGKGYTDHLKAITPPDWLSLGQPNNPAFDINTPSGLQRKVFFDLSIHMCRRGMENIEKQTQSTFSIVQVSEGVEYITQHLSVIENHSENRSGTTEEGRIYSQPGNEMCPVKCYKLYLSKLNPTLDRLWQKPLENSSNKWYAKVPVGINTIRTMMPTISNLSKLSRRYTNHELRTTAINIWKQGDKSELSIKGVSGHKSITSI